MSEQDHRASAAKARRDALLWHREGHRSIAAACRRKARNHEAIADDLARGKGKTA